MIQFLKTLIPLISLVIFQQFNLTIYTHAQNINTNCKSVLEDVNSIGEGKQKQYLEYDYFSDVDDSSFCLLSWLSIWDKQTNSQKSFADEYFESIEDPNSQTFRQLQVIVGTLRSLSSEDYYATQKSIENLSHTDAARVMNIFGWMSKSQDEGLRKNSTLFLGNAITSNGACAYFSHLAPLIDASDVNELRARANILAVGGVFAARTDVSTPQYLKRYAHDIEAEIKKTYQEKSYPNTIKSAQRIITTNNSPGASDNTNEVECAEYLTPERFDNE